MIAMIIGVFAACQDDMENFANKVYTVSATVSKFVLKPSMKSAIKLFRLQLPNRQIQISI